MRLGLMRTFLSIFLVVCTIGVSFFFQNCAFKSGRPHDLESNTSLEMQQGGSGDPYEGGNAHRITLCYASHDADALVVRITQDGDEVDVDATIGDKTVPLFDGALLAIGETVSGPWSLGTFGVITAIERRSSPSALLVFFSSNDGSATILNLKCQ